MTLAYAYITAVDGFTGEITLSNFPGGASSVSTLYVLPVAAPLFLQGADGDTLETLSDQIDGIGAGGLSAQETADAVYNLAPAGSPAAGSLGAQVEDLATTGSGAITHTITVDDGTNPIDGVEVWITTDSAGANVVAGTLTTDTLGEAEFMLDAGTYYAWMQRAGYNFTNPTEITVA